MSKPPRFHHRFDVRFAHVIACLCMVHNGCVGTKIKPAAENRPTNSSQFRQAAHRTIDSSKPIPLSDVSSFVEELPAGLAAPTQPENLLHSDPYLPRDANSEPDSFRDLTESEMLEIAFSNSQVLRPLGLRILQDPSSATTVFDPQITSSDPFFGPQAALSEFDSVLSANINAQNNDRVFNNALQEGAVQELTQDLVGVNTRWQRRNMTGAIWDLAGIHGYDNNNRLGNRFPNYWENQLEAGVRQPLLRGAGKQFNSIAGPNARPGFNFSNGIVIARLNDRISDADFAIQVRNFAQELYATYWELHRIYRNYYSIVEARDLAYRTWQTVLAKSEANLAGGEANKEAQARAKYYHYQHEVQAALGGVRGRGGLYATERRLRNLIGLPIVERELLRPTDSPAQARFVFDYEHLVSQGMTSRTELRRQGIHVRQQELRLLAAKNFLLPQMDLIGRYRLRGFGDDLTGHGSRFSSAYKDFFSLDHQEWEFGLEMGVVAGRRQAHAAVRNAALKLNRDLAILLEQQRSLRHEISDAYAEVASSYASMETSQAQVEASADRLEASQALFESDRIQIEFLLDAQEELLRSRIQLASDITAYTISLININATTGTLLGDIGVSIQNSCSQTEIFYHPALSNANSATQNRESQASREARDAKTSAG